MHFKPLIYSILLILVISQQIAIPLGDLTGVVSVTSDVAIESDSETTTETIMQRMPKLHLIPRQTEPAEEISPSKNNSRSIIKVLHNPISSHSTGTSIKSGVDICEVPSAAITMEQFFDGGDGNMVEIITDANSTDYIYENVIETIGAPEDDDLGESENEADSLQLAMEGSSSTTAKLSDGDQLVEKSSEFTMSEQAFGQEADPDSAQILIDAANESLNRMKAKLESVSFGRIFLISAYYVV